MSRILLQAFVLLICWVALPVFAAPTPIDTLNSQVKQARQQGDMDLADQLANRYLAQAQQTSDPIELAKAHFELGRNAMERNNYPVARHQLQQAIQLFKNTDQPIQLGDAYRQLGMTYRYQTEYSQALKYIYLAMNLYQQAQEPSAIASAYNSIGTTLEKMGLYESALQAHQQALEMHYQLNDKSGIATAIFNLGDLNRVMGDPKKALSYFLQSLELDLAAGDLRNIAYSHNKLGEMYCETADFAKARQHLEQALALFQKVQAPRDADWAESNLARLAMLQGQFDDAQQRLDGVITRAKANNYNSLLVDAYKIAVDLAIRKNDLDLATQYIDAGVAQAQHNQERADEAKLEKLRVEVLIQQQAIPAALTALQHQNKLNDEIFNHKRAAAIASVQTQVDFTRQQHQLELLKNEQKLQQARFEQQKLSRNFWIFGLIAFFTILLMSYRRFHQRKLNQHLSQQVAARTLELFEKNQELQQAYQQLEAISLTDNLTGLNNRHFLEGQIEQELEHCLRLYQDWQSGKTPRPAHADLVVYLIDLDHFKQLNDSYGHDIGDEVLKQLKNKMQQVFRQSDFLVRWGGEEFVVIARFIQREDASHLAHRFVELVRQTPFPIPGHAPLAISCSVGYACYPITLGERNDHWPALLKLADLCLYAAKYSGRNGWVGLEDHQSDLAISSLTLTASQMQQWSEQGLIQIEHSYQQPLTWQKHQDHSASDKGIE